MKLRIKDLFTSFGPLWVSICLVGVLVFSYFLRVYHLGSLPYGYYEEEMTNTYVGRFIFLNGKDLYGNSFPLFYFDKFGDYPPILPLYISGAATFFFGINEFAGRFPVALLGVLTSIPLFFLARRFYRSNIAGLIAAIILSAAPWHVVLSRTTAEGIIGLFTYVFGLVFCITGIEEKRRSHIVLGSGLFVFGYFLYPSLRILTPLTIFPLVIVSWKSSKIRYFVLAGLIITSLLTLYIASTPWGRARFMQTSLFSSPATAQSIRTRNELLSNGDGSNNITIARTFHNKIIGYAREFTYQYLSYFSPKHLFLSADGQYRYYNVPDQGLFLLITLPLLIAALLRRKRNSPWLWYTVYLLIITPIPAAITVDFVPHVHRAIFMLVPLILLMSAGSVNILQYAKGKSVYILSAVFLVALILESTYFWHQYSYHADAHQSLLRNDGDREMIQTVIQRRSNYARVIVPVFERLPLYYLFYTNNFNAGIIGRFKSELRLDEVDNITFFNDWCPTKLLDPTTLSPDTLLIDNSPCGLAPGYKEVLVQFRKDGTQSYRYYTPDPSGMKH